MCNQAKSQVKTHVQGMCESGNVIMCRQGRTHRGVKRVRAPSSPKRKKEKKNLGPLAQRKKKDFFFYDYIYIYIELCLTLPKT